MTFLSEDPRVRAGMPNHLLDRDAIVATGGRQIGWKLGLGTPAAREALGTPGALIAAITDRGLVGSGDLLDLSGYDRPVVEPEIAVHLRADLSGEVSVEEALAAIEGFGPAIEVADVPEDRGGVQAIVEGGIFHRAVVVGPPDTDTGAAELRTLSTWIERNGDVVARTEDPTAMTGDAVELIREVARYVGAFGETLRAGEIVITGSVVPPIAVAVGDTISVQFDRLGEVSIRF
jgi:2-keto-4-pentenoate hydratase